MNNVRVPAENLLGGEGRGLKIALVTLNTGRLTLPAACAGAAKQCLQISRRWARDRSQWGAPVGKHEATGSKLAWMASHTFAMESVSDYASGLSVRPGVDIRMEAAMAKLYPSEAAEFVTSAAIEIFGGYGYTTEYPVEKFYRDAKIGKIYEGTSFMQLSTIAKVLLAE